MGFHKTQILDEGIQTSPMNKLKLYEEKSANSSYAKLEKLKEVSEEIVGKPGVKNIELCNKLETLAV